MAINAASKIRIGGMNSGMDTQSIIDAMTAATKLRKTKQERKVKLLTAKQEAYNGIYNKLNTFKNKYFDILNRNTYLKSPSLFNSKGVAFTSTADGNAPVGVHISAGSTATSGNYEIKYVNAASQTSLKGSAVSGGTELRDFAGTFSGDTSADTYSLKVSVNGTTKNITFNGSTTASNVQDNLNAALKTAFGSTNSGDGIIKLNNTAGKWELTSASKQSISTGAIAKFNSGSVNLANGSTDWNTGSTDLTIAVGGESKTISFNSLDENYFDILENGLTQSEYFTQLKTAAFDAAVKKGTTTAADVTAFDWKINGTAITSFNDLEDYANGSATTAKSDYFKTKAEEAYNKASTADKLGASDYTTWVTAGGYKIDGVAVYNYGDVEAKYALDKNANTGSKEFLRGYDDAKAAAQKQIDEYNSTYQYVHIKADAPAGRAAQLKSVLQAEFDEKAGAAAAEWSKIATSAEKDILFQAYFDKIVTPEQLEKAGNNFYAAEKTKAYNNAKTAAYLAANPGGGTPADTAVAAWTWKDSSGKAITADSFDWEANGGYKSYADMVTKAYTGVPDAQTRIDYLKEDFSDTGASTSTYEYLKLQTYNAAVANGTEGGSLAAFNWTIGTTAITSFADLQNLADNGTDPDEKKAAAALVKQSDSYYNFDREAYGRNTYGNTQALDAFKKIVYTNEITVSTEWTQYANNVVDNQKNALAVSGKYKDYTDLADKASNGDKSAIAIKTYTDKLVSGATLSDTEKFDYIAAVAFNKASTADKAGASDYEAWAMAGDFKIDGVGTGYPNLAAITGGTGTQAKEYAKILDDAAGKFPVTADTDSLKGDFLQKYDKIEKQNNFAAANGYASYDAMKTTANAPTTGTGAVLPGAKDDAAAKLAYIDVLAGGGTPSDAEKFSYLASNAYKDAVLNGTADARTYASYTDWVSANKFTVDGNTVSDWVGLNAQSGTEATALKGTLTTDDAKYTPTAPGTSTPKQTVQQQYDDLTQNAGTANDLKNKALMFNEKSLANALNGITFADGTKISVTVDRDTHAISVNATKNNAAGFAEQANFALSASAASKNAASLGITSVEAPANAAQVTTSTTLSQLGLTYSPESLSDQGHAITDANGDPVVQAYETYSFKINDVDFSFTGDKTIQQIMDTVNASKAGVTMTYSSLNGGFEIKSNNYGTGGEIKLEDGQDKAAGVDPNNCKYLLNRLGFKTLASTAAPANDGITDKNDTGVPPTPLNANPYSDPAYHYTDGSYGTDYVKGKNLTLEVNGVLVETESNTYSADGITASFDKNVAVGETFTFNVQRDTSKAVEAVKSFIADYNQLITDVFGLVDEKKAKGDYYFLAGDDASDLGLTEQQQKDWDIAARKGMLSDDKTLINVMSRFRSAMISGVTPLSSASTTASQYSLLSVRGNDGNVAAFSFANDYKEHGKISVNEDALKEALDRDPLEIINLFTSADGLMSKISDALDYSIKTSGDRSQRGVLVQLAGGTALSASDNTISDQLKQIDKAIEALQTKYDRETERYWKKYASLESIMGKMNQQTNYLQQYGLGGTTS